MSADSKTQLADLLRAALLSVAPEQADTPINLERPKQAGHGDFASNLALQLAKPLKRNPRDLANLLLAELPASCGAAWFKARPVTWHQKVSPLARFMMRSSE